MTHKIALIFLFLLSLTSCEQKRTPPPIGPPGPEVSREGKWIHFPDTAMASRYSVAIVNNNDVNAMIKAPGKVAAAVVSSDEGANTHLILFDNPELEGNYTQLIQHGINIRQIEQINIRQKQVELERIADLKAHGAASGKDFLDAQLALSMEKTNLANEKAALIEHESKLKINGFDAEVLRRSTPGTAYVICDIPENQISRLHPGGPCSIYFTAYQDEIFRGTVDDISDVVDNDTRMVKLRIRLNSGVGRLKAGMFSLVEFQLKEGVTISIPKTAIVTIQGKNYVFVKQNNQDYLRQEVEVGPQIGDNILIFSGLKPGDRVVTENVIQLKGLSVGY